MSRIDENPSNHLDSMEKRMETGPIAAFERRISVQNSLLRYCYLQLTDTSRFREAKLYRRFESTPLRQQV